MPREAGSLTEIVDVPSGRNDSAYRPCASVTVLMLPNAVTVAPETVVVPSAR